MADFIHYPIPGAIVEYLEGNAIHIALVLEESSGKVRLLLPNRRELRLNSNRLLPWIGPTNINIKSREDIVKTLEMHKTKREEMALNVPVVEAWELAQGEVKIAPAQFFAELFETSPDIDTIAAYGRALLFCKSHFRFQPPEFEVFSKDMVEKRLEEKKIKEEREAFLHGGVAFLQMLWDVACKKMVLPENDGKNLWPDTVVLERIKHILYSRMIDPESHEDEALWNMLIKNLPDVPHLALQLLIAMGELPVHYNFWLDRANYAKGDDWWKENLETILEFKKGLNDKIKTFKESKIPFISIDNINTKDVDDAFFIEENDENIILTIALACPSLNWPFGSDFDLNILHRATSIYLPEGNCHMLPENMATDSFSLLENELRPALCFKYLMDKDINIVEFEPYLAMVKIDANLNYLDCENILNNISEQSSALKYKKVLELAEKIAKKRQEVRLANGAIIMDRHEPEIVLEGSLDNIKVNIKNLEIYPRAQSIVSEMMILASDYIASWAFEKNIALFYRTQDVVLPKEYSGIWTNPVDISKIMKALVPSNLEVQAKPHVALGVLKYAPITSPLRRYSDLVNEAQIISFLENNSAKFSKEDLENLLTPMLIALDLVSQVQRYRPRYWKLLYFKQMGDKVWWDAVIVAENDSFVTVNLVNQAMIVRAKRQIFGERVVEGMTIKVRIGKVYPLYNEIQILEAI